jgi:tape measure domain-containing protein
MADENFGIVVEINPRPAIAASGEVDRALEKNEQSAKDFKTAADESMRAFAAAARAAAKESERAIVAANKAAAQAAKTTAREAEVAAKARERAEVEAARKAAASQKAAADQQKQAQASLAASYRQIVGPAAEYNQKLAQAVALERQGAISAQQRANYVRGLQREMAQFSAQQRGGLGGAVSSFASSQIGAIAAPAAVIGATVAAGKEVIALSDAYKNLTNRIRTVTDSEAEAISVRAKLLELANRTRSDVGATTEGYVRLASATKSLNLSQSQLLSFTESLNKTIKLSGATGAEAQAGLIQFAQGLGAGALRGDELRSVMEQLGPVADVIAKQLGTTRAGLKAFGEQGKITADVVVAAFAAQREEIDRKFGKSVATFSDLWTVLHNNVEAAVGQLVEAIGGMPQLEKAFASAGKTIAEMGHGIATAVQQTKDLAGAASQLSGVMGQLAGDSDLASIATANFFVNYGKVSDLIGGKSLGAAMNAEALKINEALENWQKTVAAWQKITGGSALVDRAMGGIGGGDVDAVVKAGLKRAREERERAKQAEREHAQAVRETAAAWKEWLGEVKQNGAGVLERVTLQIDDVTGSLRNAAAEAIATAEATRVANENMIAFATTLGGDLLDSLTEAGAMVTDFAEGGAIEEGTAQIEGLSLALTETLGGALDQAIDAFVEFANGGKASFADLARSVLADIERMLIKFLAFQAIKAAFGVSTGGFGAILAGSLGINLGNNATGGSYVVPSTGSGGVDSVPIYARATPGERVTFTPPGKAAPGEMASAPPVNVNAYLVHDAEAASIAALNTPAGSRAIIAAIAANPGAVRAAVGR